MEKVIIITGGGRGIGRALSLHFAARGWAVCIVDLNRASAAEVEALVRRYSPSSRALIADIRDEKRIKALMETIAERYGHIDALVNNAGVTDKEHGGSWTFPSNCGSPSCLPI